MTDEERAREFVSYLMSSESRYEHEEVARLCAEFAAIRASARAEALEEAAEVCEQYAHDLLGIVRTAGTYGRAQGAAECKPLILALDGGATEGT